MNAKNFDKEMVDYRSFSIFSSGCKHPNFSTVFINVAAKVLQKNHSTSFCAMIFDVFQKMCFFGAKHVGDERPCKTFHHVDGVARQRFAITDPTSAQ